MANGKQDKELD